MKSEEINFTKEVFLHPWNLAFLAGALGLSFLLGLFSELGWLFGTSLLLTVSAEMIVMGHVPRLERFRRIVKARKAKEQSKPPSNRDIFSELNRANQRRYVNLRGLKNKIEANYSKFGYASQGLLESHVKKIDDLLNSCLWMMAQQQRYLSHTSSVRENEVLEDIAQIRREAKMASESVRRFKLRRLRVLERRLMRFKQRQEHLEILTEQIETIEDVVDYIHEQSLTTQDPERISLQLDVLMTDVQETEASLGDIESVFGDSTTLASFELPDPSGSDETSDDIAGSSGSQRDVHKTR